MKKSLIAMAARSALKARLFHKRMYSWAVYRLAKAVF